MERALLGILLPLGAGAVMLLLVAYVSRATSAPAHADETYRAAAAVVYADGVVTQGERRMLDALRDRLVIPPSLAEHLEADERGVARG